MPRRASRRGPDTDAGDDPDLGRARTLLALWRMARPAQLALIGLVYGFGVAMAYGSDAATASGASGFGSVPIGSIAFGSIVFGPITFGPITVGPITFGLLALVPIAASVHYANEYADVETDAITTRTPFSGGSGVLAETGLSPRYAAGAAAVSGGVGLLIVGIGVAPVAGRLLATIPAALLVLVLVVGWQYSLGPLRLAWNGLGEATNAALGGVVLPLYGFAVVAGGVTVDAALATLPFALVVFVNLLETTWPDRRADAAVGKQTLATRWSPGRLRLAYGLASAAAVVVTVALVGRVLPVVVAAVTLLPMVGLAVGHRRFTRREEPWPAVVTMVALAVATTVGWALVGDVMPIDLGRWLGV